MNALYARIKARCDEIGTTPGTICKNLGIRNSTMSELKNGIIQSVSSEKIPMFAKQLGVSCDWLLTGKEFRDNISADERVLLDAWRLASEDERENVAFILRKYGVTVPSKKVSAVS